MVHWHIRFLAHARDSRILRPYEAGLAFDHFEASRLARLLALDFAHAWVNAKDILHAEVITEPLSQITPTYYSIIVGEEEVYCEASFCRRNPCSYIEEWADDILDYDVWAGVAAHHDLLEELLA